MIWMNRSEVDAACEWHRGKPVIGEATQILSRFVELIDENSDGWSSWKSPIKAAQRLMTLIRSQDPRGRSVAPPELTEADLKKALQPIKAFCTRKNLSFACSAGGCR